MKNKDANKYFGREDLSKKLTAKEYIAQAKEVHCNLYDYSKVDYKTINQKITIICRKHGEFEQTPITHKNGSGCPVCSGNVKLTAEQFITQAKEVHEEKYDYSKANYKTNNQKVTIICREHGEFKQTPKSHRKGAGCPICSGNAKLTTEQFILKAREVHGDLYNYTKVDYKTTNQKVTIICRKHGVFEQKPNSHISSGQGCPICGGKIKLTTEQFIVQAKEVHGERYDYSKIDYKDAWKKVTIICREHGDFEQAPISHKSGTGCPVCSGKAQLSTEQFILHKDGRLEHKEFLGDENSDPRDALIEQMLGDITETGSIVAYNQSFEMSRIRELAKFKPSREEELLALNERFVDLIVPFRGRGYYHPDFNGSFSIKSVLPAMFPNSGL